MMDTQEAQELWTDELLHFRYVQAFEENPDVHHWALLTWLRDDYQDRLAAVTAERDALQQQLAECREALAGHVWAYNVPDDEGSERRCKLNTSIVG